MALLVVACESSPPTMHGEHNVLVIAPDTLWTRIQDATAEAVRPDLPGLPREATYRLGQSSSEDVSESDLLSYRHIVLFGDPADERVAEALGPAGAVPDQATGVHQRADVWADGQRVIVALLPSNGQAEAALQRLPAVASLLDGSYRAFTRQRVYARGVDADLTEQLAADGIGLQIPPPYRPVEADGSARRFMTFGSDQSRVIRSLLITWSSMDDAGPTTEPALEWRGEVADRYYDGSQTVLTESVRARPIGPEAASIEVGGVWQGVMDGRLQAGPFISRVIDCADQDRRYFLDAWVLAPGTPKYTYIIQMEAVLDSFDCSPQADTAEPSTTSTPD